MTPALAASRRLTSRVTTQARSVLGGVSATLRTGGSERRSLFSYALYTLGVFAIALAATFPHDLVLQRALQRANAGGAFVVETGGATLGWNLAYGIDSLRVRLRGVEGEPILHAEQVRFAPSLLGLARGSVYPLGVAASLYGGTLRGTIDPRPARFRIDAVLADVDLARYAGLGPLLEGAIRGRVQGTLDVDGGGRGPAAAAGTVELKLPGLVLEDVKIRGITVPNLHFADVHLDAKLRNGRLEVAELVAAGDEVTIRGDGNVVVRTPFESSVMNLDLVVTPASAASDGLRMAINLLPGASGEGGSRRIAVGGTLAHPALR